MKGNEMADIDLAALIARHGCRYLVESGVGGVEAALDLDLDQIYGIEPNHKRALDVALKFAANHKATIIHARWEKGLKEALEEMRPDLPALFRLAGPEEEAVLRRVATGRDLGRDLLLVGDAAP